MCGLDWAHRGAMEADAWWEPWLPDAWWEPWLPDAAPCMTYQLWCRHAWIVSMASDNGARQRCQTTVAISGAEQCCRTTVPDNGADQRCRTTVPNHGAEQQCQTTAPNSGSGLLRCGPYHTRGALVRLNSCSSCLCEVRPATGRGHACIPLTGLHAR